MYASTMHYTTFVVAFDVAVVVGADFAAVAVAGGGVVCVCDVQVIHAFDVEYS